jgi:preprotein translocase subunit SecG
MDIIVGFVVAGFVAICFLLVIVILLQDSKGEGLSSSAFGGSGLESVLGGHGATTFLSRLTTWTAIGFMVIALFLMKFYGESNNLAPIDESNVSEVIPTSEKTSKAAAEIGASESSKFDDLKTADSEKPITTNNQVSDESQKTSALPEK